MDREEDNPRSLKGFLLMIWISGFFGGIATFNLILFFMGIRVI